MNTALGAGMRPLALNNFGNEFDELYVHEAEMKAAEWSLDASRTGGVTLSMDSRTTSRLWLVAKSSPRISSPIIFKSDVKGYLLTSVANRSAVGYTNVGSRVLRTNFPIEYASQDMNRLYASGGSGVFER
jgi:hypothetical protein